MPSRATSATRSSPATWLIGGASPSIPVQKRLPTLRNVLQFVLHLRETEDIRDACRLAVKEILPIWEAGIGAECVMEVKDATTKLLGIYKEWIELKRSMNRKTNPRREAFIKSLDALFDIGRKDALDNIKEEEDRAFYLSMQGDRKAFMTSVDKKWVKKRDAQVKRREMELKRKRRSDESVQELFSKSSSAAVPVPAPVELEESGKEDDEFVVEKKRKKRTVKLDILKCEVTSALDRTQTSDRFASHIIKKAVEVAVDATVDALGVDKLPLGIKPVFSKATIQRKRRKNRETVVENIRKDFSSEEGPFLVHWDAKLLADSDDKKKYDRLAVILTGPGGVEQLLGVPKLEKGTGKAQADATFKLLDEWKVKDKVAGKVYDTTGNNVGWIKGASVLLQQLLEKADMLEFGCHHHSLELSVGAAFYSLFENSKDPNLPFFEKLESEWDKIDKGTYRTAASSRKLKEIPEADDIIQFCLEQLRVQQPRGDYKENLELVIVFLGGVVPDKHVYQFKRPGCRSKCRWMAINIYCLKSWLLGKQLKLTRKDDTSLFNMCVFLCRAYTRAWFLAPLAAQAPRNDLSYLQVLYQLKDKGPHFKAALNKFSNHLWFLSPTSVPMALFDSGVSVAEKKLMAAALCRGGDDGSPLPTRAKVCLEENVLNLQLSDFFSIQSMRFFSATGLSPKFLEKDPYLWGEDSDYLHGQNVVNCFKVVNDSAERGVALITKFLKGNKLTQDEEQRQLP